MEKRFRLGGHFSRVYQSSLGPSKTGFERYGEATAEWYFTYVHLGIGTGKGKQEDVGWIEGIRSFDDFLKSLNQEMAKEDPTATAGKKADKNRDKKSDKRKAKKEQKIKERLEKRDKKKSKKKTDIDSTAITTANSTSETSFRFAHKRKLIDAKVNRPKEIFQVMSLIENHTIKTTRKESLHNTGDAVVGELQHQMKVLPISIQEYFHTKIKSNSSNYINNTFN